MLNHDFGSNSIFFFEHKASQKTYPSGTIHFMSIHTAHTFRSIHTVWFPFIWMVLILTACSGAQPAPTITPQPIVQETATAVPTETAVPTAAPSKVMLVTPPQGGEQLTQNAQTLLQELASNSNLTLETRASVTPGDLNPEWKVVVFLSSPENLSELLAAVPQTQFLVISTVDLQPAANLSVIRYRPENQNFMAGYLATEIAGDWRSAGIFPTDGILGAQAQEAFQNGGRYLCGICNTMYGPFVRFPIVAAQPAASAPGVWQVSIDELILSVPYALYIAPEAASQEVLEYAASKNIILLGGQTPPDSVRSYWAATIQLDPVTPIREIWPTLLNGEGGQLIEPALQISDTQSGILSPGRQLYAETVYQSLSSGLIFPFNPPQ